MRLEYLLLRDLGMSVMWILFRVWSLLTYSVMLIIGRIDARVYSFLMRVSLVAQLVRALH